MIGWDQLGRFGISWDQLGQLGSIGISWDQLRSNVTSWDQLGSAGISWDQLGSAGARLGRFRSGQVRPCHSAGTPVEACVRLRILRIGGETLGLACGIRGAHSEYARGTPGDVLQRFGIRGPWHREKLRKIDVELPGAGHS